MPSFLSKKSVRNWKVDTKFSSDRAHFPLESFLGGKSVPDVGVTPEIEKEALVVMCKDVDIVTQPNTPTPGASKGPVHKKSLSFNSVDETVLIPTREELLSVVAKEVLWSSPTEADLVEMRKRVAEKKEIERKAAAFALEYEEYKKKQAQRHWLVRFFCPDPY